MSAPKGMTPIAEGEHMGIEWCVVAAPMPGANGYVKVPDEGHPWHGKGYDEIDVEAPGGLTFGEAPGWIGFDTLHGWDYWPPEEVARLGKTWRLDTITDSSAEVHWTLERVIEETRKLAARTARAVWA